MNNNQMIEICYKEYDAQEGVIIAIEPYCLKTYHHRWYVLGRLTDGTLRTRWTGTAMTIWNIMTTY